MKILAVLGVSAAATSAFLLTQPPNDGRPGPPPDPIFELFDTNRDESISMDEIDAAADILKKRDTDGNGTLTRDELPRPPRPPRHGGEPPQQCRDGNPGPPPRERKDESPADSPRRQRPLMDEESDAAAGSVLIRDGYQTNPIDNGRPVALIAAALGVEEQTFRDAFRNVRPSRFGPPSHAQAQANKKVLMDALSKYGVTNDRLDEVSNYYRYRPEAGELWTVATAKVNAIIENGKVTGFDIVDGGSGYLSVPKVVVVGYPDVAVEATIEFTEDLKTNGRITALNLINN